MSAFSGFARLAWADRRTSFPCHWNRTCSVQCPIHEPATQQDFIGVIRRGDMSSHTEPNPGRRIIKQFLQTTIPAISFYGLPWLNEFPNRFGGKIKKERYLCLMAALAYAIIYEELAFNWWWWDEANRARGIILAKQEVRHNLDFFRSCVNDLNRRDPKTLELPNSQDTLLETVGCNFLGTFGYVCGAVPDSKIRIVALFANYLHNSIWASFNNEMMPHWITPSSEIRAKRAAMGVKIDAEIC